MYKLRGIIGFYLTVALLLTAALMPFGDAFMPVSLFTEAVSESESTDTEYSEAAGTQGDITDGLFKEEDFSSDEDLTEEESTEKTEEESVKAEEEASDMLILSEKKEPVLHGSKALKENIFPLYFFSENTGFLSSSDEANVYTFSLDSRTCFYYTVSHKEIIGTAGWNVSLYVEYYLNGIDGETGYRLINTLLTKPSVTKDQSVKLGLIPGNYRLVVTKGSAFTGDNYRIDVFTEEGSDYEIECNDNIYRYTSLFSSVPIKGSASYFTDRQDEDWYMFRQYEDGFAELKFEHPPVKDKTTVCWQIILFSENGTVLYSVNSLFTDNMLRSGAVGLKKGNYYVLVRNRVYTDMTYMLTLSRSDNVTYENEKNDTIATANEITLNSTVTGSVAQMLSGIDRDYFCFAVDAPGAVMLEFSHLPTEEDKDGWNISLLDKNGTALYREISKWSDDILSSPEIGLDTGIYYVLIDSDNLYLNPDDYYLTVTFFPGDDFESEPNNSFEKADVLTADTPVTGIISDCETDYDYDYYTFTTEKDMEVSVILDHEVLAGNKEIFSFSVYDSDLSPVSAEVGGEGGFTDIGVPANAERVQADFKVLPAGTYYIKVSSGLFYEQVSYYLFFTMKEI
ncbi:MAG: hypothetical protein E7535_01700 [Ruminococcaceae bacterium]|nr:hypothetical protein [Oscillospiraceae bacterium]